MPPVAVLVVMTMTVVVTVTVTVLVVPGSSDARVDEQREELPPFDQLGIAARLVNLNIQQEPPWPEDVLRIDDAGRLLTIE